MKQLQFDIDANPKVCSSGIIVVSDVVGFSRLDTKTQKNIVCGLWDFLSSNKLLLELDSVTGHKPLLNGTGDGVLIALPRGQAARDDESNGESRTLPIPKEGQFDFQDYWSKVVEMCFQWHDHVERLSESLKTKVKIKIAAHIGMFVIVDVSKLGQGGVKFGGKQVVGAGPNHCARLVNLSDAGSVLLSESYFSEWSQFDADCHKRFLFDPKPNDKAIEVVVKHQEELRARAVAIRGESSKKIVAPYRLRFVDTINKRIKRYLFDIVADIVEEIENAINLKQGTKELATRATIWTPHPTQKALAPTEYRISPSNEDFERANLTDSPQAQSQIMYSITGSGQGPTGRCFCSKDGVFVLNDLPQCRDITDGNFSEYCTIMKKQTGVKKADVKRFSRFARSYLQFSVAIDDRVPEGVVCLDLMHPLTELDKDKLWEMCAERRYIWGVPIAALLRIRTH